MDRHSMIKCDRLGFPYLFIEEGSFWMQFFPLTKVQYEMYLVETGKSNADYEPLLALNPRITLKKATPDNYERLFLAGISVDETKHLAHWLNPGKFCLPTEDEWRLAYQWACKKVPIAIPIDLKEMNEFSRKMWEKLNDIIGPSSLAQQMLMVNGLLEWVKLDILIGAPWGGMGKSRTEFAAYLRNPDSASVKPVNVHDRKFFKHFGCRFRGREI